MSFLQDLSKEFIKLSDIFAKNKGSPIQKWLNISSFFPKQGKQGITGIVTVKEDNKEMVFKVSQYLNHTVIHESLVMKGLNELHDFCPHFCRSFGYGIYDISPKVKKDNTLFNPKGEIPIKKEILFIENIEGKKLLWYIENIQDENIIFSLIKQTMVAICIAQKEKNFTHNDLHPSNILIRECDPDSVFVYILDEENQFCIPTYGYYPVIIDFGFSYISDMEDEPFWNTLAHTDVGFLTDRFNWLSDPKLFLVSTMYDLSQVKKSKNISKFTDIVEEMFSPLDIDWEAGWDTESNSVISDLLDFISPYNPGSALFSNKDGLCIDIIQSLLILPLEKRPYSNIGNMYNIFVKEFMKIEKELNSEFYSLYILKNIVDITRRIRPYYLDDTTRVSALRKFKEQLFTAINSVAKFFKPSDINYETLLCSLVLLTRCMEGILYDMMIVKEYKKTIHYNDLNVNSTLEIYGAIELAFPSKYVFNTNSTIIFLDSINKKTEVHKLDKSNIDTLANYNVREMGCALYDILYLI